ncbi:MAG: hypothetical protein V2B19_05525 [Pseudomonadota bacterium]
MVKQLLKPEKVPQPESPMAHFANGNAGGIIRYFRPVIKIAQLIILAAGLIAFTYGACQLGLDLRPMRLLQTNRLLFFSF